MRGIYSVSRLNIQKSRTFAGGDFQHSSDVPVIGAPQDGADEHRGGYERSEVVAGSEHGVLSARNNIITCILYGVLSATVFLDVCDIETDGRTSVITDRRPKDCTWLTVITRTASAIALITTECAYARVCACVRVCVANEDDVGSRNVK